MIHPYYRRLFSTYQPLYLLEWFQKPTLTERNVYTHSQIVFDYGRGEEDQDSTKGSFSLALG